jgi:hypothetical protein
MTVVFVVVNENGWRKIEKGLMNVVWKVNGHVVKCGVERRKKLEVTRFTKGVKMDGGTEKEREIAGGKKLTTMPGQAIGTDDFHPNHKAGVEGRFGGDGMGKWIAVAKGKTDEWGRAGELFVKMLGTTKKGNRAILVLDISRKLKANQIVHFVCVGVFQLVM